MNYFAKIKYLGTDFHGFQVQPELRTVQGVLCEALRSALGGEVMVTGCSRTDAGVHANEFCVRIDAPSATVPSDKLSLAVSRFLPKDLSLFWASECDVSFHPRYDVKEKEYLYRIVNQRVYDPFLYGRVYFLPRPITDEALANMQAAAKHFIGKFDFSTFMSEGSDVEDTVRCVSSLTVDRIGDEIDISIRADGFLYNMVRIIVGTLIEVAYGRTLPSEIPDIINSKDRTRAGMTAPPEGLYLNRVIY